MNYFFTAISVDFDKAILWAHFYEKRREILSFTYVWQIGSIAYNYLCAKCQVSTIVKTITSSTLSLSVCCIYFVLHLKIGVWSIG